MSTTDTPSPNARPRILICYGTRGGSARTVAHAMAEGMDDAEVDVRDVTEVGSLDYDLIVLGSSIRFGSIHPAMVTFLEEHRAELASIPRAVFAVCFFTIFARRYLRRMKEHLDGDILAYRVFVGRAGPISLVNRSYAKDAGTTIRSLV